MQQLIKHAFLDPEREIVNLRVLGVGEVIEAAALFEQPIRRLIERIERLRREHLVAEQLHCAALVREAHRRQRIAGARLLRHRAVDIHAADVARSHRRGVADDRSRREETVQQRLVRLALVHEPLREQRHHGVDELELVSRKADRVARQVIDHRARIDTLARRPHVVRIVAERERGLGRTREDLLEPRRLGGRICECRRITERDRPLVVGPRLRGPELTLLVPR